MKFFPNKYLVILASIIAIYFFVIKLAFANTQFSLPTATQKQLAALEAAFGGRIGLYALDTANNTQIEYHANERFPMNCTAKMMGVSAILKKSMTDKRLLQEKIKYRKRDLVEWSPITKKHVADGMTISQLCKAAITISDNTAMNILLKKLGGPKALNAFARSIGNYTFNLKSGWPNEALWQWGEVRDTSTPAAMGKSLQRLALGNVLALPQRKLLLTWLKASITGNARIRAGVPKDWIVADKTGTGFYYGTMGDIGIIWPPKCHPIILAIYYKKDKKDATQRQNVIALATRIVLNGLAYTDKCVDKALLTAKST